MKSAEDVAKKFRDKHLPNNDWLIEKPLAMALTAYANAKVKEQIDFSLEILKTQRKIARAEGFAAAKEKAAKISESVKTIGLMSVNLALLAEEIRELKE